MGKIANLAHSVSKKFNRSCLRMVMVVVVATAVVVVVMVLMVVKVVIVVVVAEVMLVRGEGMLLTGCSEWHSSRIQPGESDGRPPVWGRQGRVWASGAWEDVWCGLGVLNKDSVDSRFLCPLRPGPDVVMGEWVLLGVMARLGSHWGSNPSGASARFPDRDQTQAFKQNWES